ncbi:hypothetical protein ABS764_01150 [Flavobacterium sp. ST-87]|uniref:Uncharacterized protein n=1 Tax=Flavobacterium plantiphilum TaxID=3163297 RepID=A0ABW8XQ61_9FLAO
MRLPRYRSQHNNKISKQPSYGDASCVSMTSLWIIGMVKTSLQLMRICARNNE